MTAVSPRMSPRVRRIRGRQQPKDVHGASNRQEVEEVYGEENSPLLGDKSGEQAANRAPVVASPRRWQQHNEVQSCSNMQDAMEAYKEEGKTTDIDSSCTDDVEPDNKADNCLDVNLAFDQSIPWTGEKRAKVIASPPTPEVSHYTLIEDPRDKEEFWDVYEDPEQLNKVQERLALYRIKAHQQSWEGKELDIAQLKEEYSSDTLRDHGYFEHYELNREWYFDPEYCKRSALDDYQRLVLHNYHTYMSWESYHATCTTLKCDQEFLQFYEELSRKLKSIEDVGVERNKEHFDAQWERYEIKAETEAPKIASCFSSINADLVQEGIADCMWSTMFDLTYYKDLDNIFFEIWKRVAKDKVDFMDALEDLRRLDLYPLQRESIKAEFEELPMRTIMMKEAYYSHVAHIDENVPENEVIVLIKEAVNKILPKPLIYVDYIRKKLEVAKKIGVIP